MKRPREQLGAGHGSTRLQATAALSPEPLGSQAEPLGGRSASRSRGAYYGTWLQVRAECSAPGATVTANGPPPTAEDIGRLLAGMEAMQRRESGSAELSPLEPNLIVSLTGSSRGRLRIDVRVTPDSMTQEHRFFFDTDVAYLAGPIEQCREIPAPLPRRRAGAGDGVG